MPAIGPDSRHPPRRLRRSSRASCRRSEPSGGGRRPPASSHAAVGARDYDGHRRWNVVTPRLCRPISSRARRSGTVSKPRCQSARKCGSFWSCSGRISRCSRSSGRSERGRGPGRSSRRGDCCLKSACLPRYSPTSRTLWTSPWRRNRARESNRGRPCPTV